MQIRMTREQIEQAKDFLKKDGAKNNWLLPLCDLALEAVNAKTPPPPLQDQREKYEL